MRTIVAISGGMSSAWCAEWALRNKKNVVLYFNDTFWEHESLYGFLKKLSCFWGQEIIFDSDGRSPEALFYQEHCIANNRMPFCSRILKAKRLQNFMKNGDEIVFGIGQEEMARANRIVAIYQVLAAKTDKSIKLSFPLITEKRGKEETFNWLKTTGIELPLLYKLGFAHNNCAGGCVRATEGQWRRLYWLLPEVFKERKRVEKEVSSFFQKEMTYLNGISLEEIEQQEKRQMRLFEDIETTDNTIECVGICNTLS